MAAASTRPVGHMVECAIDIGEDNTSHCVLEAYINEETGAPCIAPVALELYPVSKIPNERSLALKRRFEAEPSFHDVDEFGVEVQVPMLMPENKLRAMAPAVAAGIRKAATGNIVAYGIAQNALGVLTQAYPKAVVTSVSPKEKFKDLGLSCPKSKPRRKTRAKHFFHTWLYYKRADPLWRKFTEKYISHPKRDDMADSFCTALGRIIRRVAKSIDLRKVGNKRKKSAPEKKDSVKQRRQSD